MTKLSILKNAQSIKPTNAPGGTLYFQRTKNMDKNRKQKIMELRKRGMKLAKIGLMQKPPISSERVRQILESDKRVLCKKHNIMTLGVCKYCAVENDWKKGLDGYPKIELEREIKTLSKRGRGAVVSLKRKILIKKIKDEWGLSFSELGRRFNRDRTTISNYYNGN